MTGKESEKWTVIPLFVKDTVIGDVSTGKDHEGEEKLRLCQTGGRS